MARPLVWRHAGGLRLRFTPPPMNVRKWVIRDRAEPGSKPGYVRYVAESGSKFIALMASPPGIAA